MAFADILNQAAGNLTGTPLGQLGIGLLAASGPQQGNPAGAARLGQALQGMTEMQAHQALQQYRQQMIAAQQQQQAMQTHAAQAKQDQLQRQQAALQDPAVLDQLGPLARAMSASGVDIGSILRAQSGDNLQQHRQAQLQQQQAQFDQRQANASHSAGGGQPGGPRMRAMPTLIPEHLPDGMIQDHKLNPKTGEFEPFGAPYSKYAPGRAKTNKAVDAMADEIAPAPDGQGLDALPGAGGLQSYMPKPQAPTGVMPMSAAGSLPTAKPAAAASQAQYPGAPAVGTVKKGYRYNGGNPADPGSWSKA